MFTNALRGAATMALGLLAAMALGLLAAVTLGVAVLTAPLVWTWRLLRPHRARRSPDST